MSKLQKKIIGVILALTLMLGSVPIAAAENGLLAPENLTVSLGEKNGQINVSMNWSAVEGAQGYEIYYRMNNGDLTSDYEDWSEWVLSGNSTENHYIASFIKEKKYVQLRVRAINGTEFSKFSTVKSVDLYYKMIHSLWIKISSFMKDLYAGEKTTLQVDNATDPSTWRSSDESIATVDEKGVVTGKKEGRCKITAISNDKEYSCDLHVRDYTKANAYRDELNEYISKNNNFALLDINQDGAKELLIIQYSAASISTKINIYTFHNKKLKSFTVPGYGILAYYKESKWLKNSLFSFDVNEDGKGLGGGVEYYSLSKKNKLVTKQKVTVKGKATKIKWYEINRENMDKYITYKLK